VTSSWSIFIQLKQTIYDLSSENHVLYVIMWKIWYSRRGNRWQYNMTHALSMLDT